MTLISNTLGKECEITTDPGTGVLDGSSIVFVSDSASDTSYNASLIASASSSTTYVDNEENFPTDYSMKTLSSLDRNPSGSTIAPGVESSVGSGDLGGNIKSDSRSNSDTPVKRDEFLTKHKNEIVIKDRVIVNDCRDGDSSQCELGVLVTSPKSPVYKQQLLINSGRIKHMVDRVNVGSKLPKSISKPIKSSMKRKNCKPLIRPCIYQLSNKQQSIIDPAILTVGFNCSSKKINDGKTEVKQELIDSEKVKIEVLDTVNGDCNANKSHSLPTQPIANLVPKLPRLSAVILDLELLDPNEKILTPSVGSYSISRKCSIFMHSLSH